MQYTLTISQTKALEWDLNAQQALLFSFVYECPSWANPITTTEGIYYALSKAKIVEELPLLTDKPDTAYRLLKQLEAAGVVELSHTPGITLVRLTDKGKEWNKALDGSEKYPSKKTAGGRKKIRSTSEKSPSKVGKKSELGSEKSPTNQGTSNQGTNQDTSHNLPVAAGAAHGEVIPNVTPRVEIPSDMPGPKDQTCKTFRTWANYAFAYRKRYSTWPVWNAKAGGQVGQLIDRLGADVAPQVAAYYLTTSDAQVIRDCHSLNILVAKAEAIHTQWATGRQMTSATARQQERTAANFEAAQTAAQNILNKAEGSIYDNPFFSR